MENIRKIIREILIKQTTQHKCSCGCNTCENVGNPGPILNENISSRIIMSENMKYHIDNKVALTENTFRYGSDAFLDLWAEARYLYSRNAIYVNDLDKEILFETNLGEYGMYEGKKVPLDLPMLEEEELEESKDKKKNPPIGKPKRGGSKKFYVYVRDPKTKKIKKVSFGDTTGLSVKINDPKARRAFAKRHRCGTGESKTSARYWSCRLPRFSKLLGLKSSYSGFW